MTQDPDEERIRRKAHELWEAEGQPHGRDRDHWDQAREIVAIEDSQASTLLPRNTGAEEPIEPRQAIDNYGDMPNLTDQGEHPLTDIGREPESTSPSHFINTTGDTVGHVARPREEPTPGIYDSEIVSPPPTPAPVSGKPAAAVTTKPVTATGKTASKSSGKPESPTRKSRNSSPKTR